jgi:hypothetical protein
VDEGIVSQRSRPIAAVSARPGLFVATVRSSDSVADGSAIRRWHARRKVIGLFYLERGNLVWIVRPTSTRFGTAGAAVSRDGTKQ